MFKSKIAGLRDKLKFSYRVMSDSYVLINYPEEFKRLHDVELGNFDGLKEEVAKSLIRTDKFCYWTADCGMSIDAQYPVIIDFENDLQYLAQTLSEDDLVGLIKVAAEDMRNGKCHFPFEDMVINVGACETPDSKVLEDVCVRIRNVTKSYRIELDESVDTMIEISMMHTISDKDYDFTNRKQDIYMASCKPQIVELFEDEVILEQNLLWGDKILDFIYGPFVHSSKTSKASAFKEDEILIENLNDVARTSMMTIVVLFLFFYRHQRVYYKEVEIPRGIARKRTKKKQTPYTNYFVSSIGDFTKTVYTESRPSENPVSGVAMHVRRGHYQLWPNHRRLPHHLQKRTWVPSYVAGDPRYGIIIRDYLSEMTEGGEVTKEKLQQEIREREIKHE